MSETRVMRCSCKHEYQDKEHGDGRRVHNKSEKYWSCTVCSSQKPLREKP